MQFRPSTCFSGKFQQLEEREAYIQNLESEQATCREKIKRLNRIAERYNQQTEFADATLQYAAKGANKAINALNNEVNKKHAKIYGDKNV